MHRLHAGLSSQSQSRGQSLRQDAVDDRWLYTKNAVVSYGMLRTRNQSPFWEHLPVFVYRTVTRIVPSSLFVDCLQ